MRNKNPVNIMAICDICGRSRPTKEVNLEGAIVEACKACSPKGAFKTQRPGKKPFHKRQKKADLPKVNFEFVEDFGKVIKEAREKADITQKDLGLKLNEHSSVIHKIEQGTFRPRIGLAKKIEKILKIRIITKIEQLDKEGNVINNKKTKRTDDKDGSDRSGDGGDLVYTLADVIKVKKK